MATAAFMDASSILNKKAREVQDASSIWSSGVREAREISKIAMDPNRNQNEKLRSILYSFFTPTVKPKFFDDAKSDSSGQTVGLPNVSALNPSPTRAPLRMLDIDTRNLVSTFSLGRDDRYCIVSHSWKGREIDFGYFCQAKQRDPKSNIENDFQVVKDQCSEDLKRIKEMLDDMLKSSQTSVKFDGLDDLLCRRIAAKKAEDGLAWMQAKHNDALADYDNVKREDQAHAGLLSDLLEGDLKSEKLVIRARAEEQQRDMDEMRREEVNKAEQAVDEAKTQLDMAIDEYNARHLDIKFFEENRQVFYAVEDLFGSLQRRKSAVKIENTICRAKELFEQKGYRATGKRYVWLDTCCIDKSNSHELTESLALMGEWYANADFCLVHLDTSRSDEEWLYEWDSWKFDKDGTPPVCIPKINKLLEPRQGWSQPKAIADFGEILERKPEWATRGWTLQELILSKMTYYVNHHWELLDRPVDALGQYYYLCPLISQYVGDETLLPAAQEHGEAFRNINELEKISRVKKRDDETKPESFRIQRAQMLIAVLESIGFRTPRHIDEDNARAHITHVVRSATEQLASRKSAAGPFEDICKLMGIRAENNEKYVIDILLRALVHETKELIKDDRKYIAKFSNVEPLETWAQGIGSDDSSAHRVLMLASNRRCTVATDKAYSLMGILGVQFPAFSAEGLTKALSRVIDEVIVTSNDVSVFNWAGEHQGSPIRGRSLYPCSLDAFQPQKACGRVRAERNARLADIFEKDCLEQPEIGKRINKLLGGAIDSVKYLHDESPALQWLERLGDFIKGAIFEELQPNLENLERLLRFIEGVSKSQGTGNENENSNVVEEDAHHEQGGGENDKQIENKESGFRLPTMGKPSLPFGWTSAKSTGKDQVLQSGSKSEAESPAEMQLRGLHQPVEEYIEELSQNVGPYAVKLPEALNEALDDSAGPSPDTRSPQAPGKQKPESIATKMVCPNPISVTSSGIKGAFDIQRVIINMLQPEKLRSQIANAASAHEKISGWCTVSTGFALAMVGFSCEKHVLEQQMNVVDVINHTILGCEPAETGSTDAGVKANNDDKPGEKQPPTEAGSEETTEVKQEEDPSTQSFLKNYGNTEEERKVSRMIDFVQEPNLHAIAGEWVLARFSGTPGAKWFLCRLELGSGYDFYGRRVASGELDFHDAVPEKGLFEHWRRYMMTKKDILCSSLSFHLDGKRSGKFAKDLQKKVMKDEDADKKADGDLDSGEDSKLSSVWDAIELVGWETRRMFVEKLAEHRDDLEGILGELALKRVPPRLQAAILDFNARKSLLPLMFHSGREIHMF